MNLKVKIRRFNPEKDRRPYWSEFKVEVQKMDRVLDVLQTIKENQDGSVTFRRSCAHGVCGSDAMVINGRNRLACKLLVQDVGRSVVIEPLRGLPVIKDLVVDMEPFWRQYKSIRPFMMNDDDPPYTERLQSPEARRAIRRHDQVHPLCGLHHVLSQLLGRWQLCRSGRDRAGPPLDFRRPRPGRASAARDTRGRKWCVEVPDHLQLH